VDRFAVLRGVGLESPAITGEVPEHQPPKSPSARTPSELSGRASERPVEAVNRRCPGEAQRQVSRQLRGHQQRRQQKSPAAMLPSPRGAHWGAQERRGRQAVG